MGKMEINNEWKKMVKINNLKVAKNLSFISKEEFTLEVKTILDM
jgi:hypothetical protein